MTRLGYQIPNFTLPGVSDDQLFATVARSAKAAEDAGFDTILAMDHFYQLPALGPPENAMLECYGLLTALAGYGQPEGQEQSCGCQARRSAFLRG